MNLKNLISEIKDNKKISIIIFIGLAGIFLLAICNYSADSDIDSNEDKVIENTTKQYTAEEIENRLEDRLVKVISSVSGVGNVQVMVTVASAGEYVYAENKKYDKDSDSTSTDTEIVIYDNNDSDSGLVISIKSPDVLGVAVVCEGGNSAVVKSEITNLVTSLFGIGADRVYVGSKAA